MRVAMYYHNHDIRLEEMPIPSIGSGELLVKIYSSGVCGSDVMEWYRINKAPLVLGHEIAGEVVAVGGGIKSFVKGDRVAATHHVPCFSCPYCMSGHETVCDTLLSGTHFDPGGFCEYVRLPAINVDRGTWKIPGTMTYDEATFVEPLACILRGLRTVKFEPGKSVLVLGSGISGLLFISLARALGAMRIIATDVNAYRLKAGKQVGADDTIDGRKNVSLLFRERNQGRGADVVIVTAGVVGTFEQALQAVERGGTILFFAPTRENVTTPLSINDVFWRKDITLTTTYAGSPADCVTALGMIHSRRIPIPDMITHHFGLQETVKGFGLVEKGDESIKIIIRPQE